MKKKKRGLGKWTAGLAVVLVAAAGAYYYLQDSAVEVEVFDVFVSDLYQVINETGTAESDNTVVVSSKTGGEVTSVRVSEGDSVSRGDALLTIDQSAVNQQSVSRQIDIQALQVEAAGLQDQYDTARELADKNRTLYEEGVISYEDYNLLESEAKQLLTKIESLNYSISSARAAVTFESSTITAPINGVVTLSRIKPGEIAVAASPLLEISDMDRIHIKADLIAEDANKVQEGQRVILYGDDKTVIDDNAAVSKVHIKAQEKMSELGIVQKRVTVEIKPSEGTVLRLGGDLDIEVVTDERKDAVSVPKKSIFELNMEHYVYVIQDGTAKLRKIEKGLEAETYAEVLTGLSPGEKVVLSPGADLDDGVRVEIRE